MNNPKPSRLFLVEVAAIAAIFGTLYLLTLGRTFVETPDTLAYIQEIDGRHFFAAPHLLYNVAAAQWVSFWRLFGLTGHDITLCIESLNAVSGALAVMVFFAILRKRVGLGFFPALCASALPAFSYGLWLYSITAQVIAIPLFLLMLAFYLLTAPRLSAVSCFWLGLIHGLAVLFYQMNGLFLLVALDVLLLQKKRLNISRFRALCLYVVPLGLAVVLVYGAVMLFEHSFHSWHEAMIWLLNYATDTSGRYLRVNSATVVDTCIGAGHAIIGGHFLFNLPPVKHFLELTLISKALAKNAFLTRNLPVNAVYWLMILTALACVIVLLGNALVMARRRGSLWRQSPLWRSGLLWLILYSVFAIIWCPSDVQFWIYSMVLFWLLLVILWCGGGEFPAHRQLTPALAFAVIAACLAAVNYGGSVYWFTKPENDYYRVKISPIVQKAERGDLTILFDPWRLDGYLERFTKSDFTSLPSSYDRNGEQALEKLIAAIDSRLAEGRRVFIIQQDALPGAPTSDKAGFTSFIEEADRNLHERYAHSWLSLPTEVGVVYMLEAQYAAKETAQPQ